MTPTNRLEAVGATAGTVTSLASCLADANAFLQVAIGVATLAWWIRLWLKNPNQGPPK